MKLYSQQGVQEYGIVNKDLPQVQIYRRDNAPLTLALTLQANDTLTSPLLPGFSWALSRIFGRR
nr:Uma2 family endonuclease [Halomicronema hongdechloris]